MPKGRKGFGGKQVMASHTPHTQLQESPAKTEDLQQEQAATKKDSHVPRPESPVQDKRVNAYRDKPRRLQLYAKSVTVEHWLFNQRKYAEMSLNTRDHWIQESIQFSHIFRCPSRASKVN